MLGVQDKLTVVPMIFLEILWPGALHDDGLSPYCKP